MAIHQEPIDFIDIPAPQHSPNAYYRVVYGDVDWSEDNNFRRAIYVLMGYENGINYRRVAHVLTTPNEPNGLSDLDLVQTAIQKLKERNNVR
ncbi:hypothetical protein CV093_10180 [Oceanobacillus sp. 143]|uniref:Uncharacterized protein n=1 Tax=Oceanobacillus zhaokaii TaxID=2052660 RepID=A0A345PGP4_9BACI|nr:hypothetical protein [Oceanobacillus zhaokaii]AXI09174.1 hypothetical protein CUC15_09650 [Oceanobacillus zhaokaii]QGS68706.1 hypothetical protein CV093_10180 [Oceanobacillus sp. 143]